MILSTLNINIGNISMYSFRAYKRYDRDSMDIRRQISIQYSYRSMASSFRFNGSAISPLENYYGCIHTRDYR